MSTAGSIHGAEGSSFSRARGVQGAGVRVRGAQAAQVQGRKRALPGPARQIAQSLPDFTEAHALRGAPWRGAWRAEVIVGRSLVPSVLRRPCLGQTRRTIWLQDERRRFGFCGRAPWHDDFREGPAPADWPPPIVVVILQLPRERRLQIVRYLLPHRLACVRGSS